MTTDRGTDDMRKSFIKGAAAILCAVIVLTSCTSGSGIGSRDFDQRFNQRWYNQSCASEDAIYFVSNFRIMFYDRESGIVAPLCAKPECSHTSADCNAYFTGGSLSFYDGKLYWINNNMGACDIMCKNPNGTQSMTVRSVDGGLIGEDLPGVGAINPEIAFHRGDVYYSAIVGDIQGAKQDTFVIATRTGIDNGDNDGIIYRNDYMSEISIKPYKDEVYIIAFGKDESTLEIYRYDILSGDGQVIYSDSCDISAQRGSFHAMVFDGMIIMTCNASVYRFDLESYDMEQIYSLNSDDGYYPYAVADGYVMFGYNDGSSFKLRTVDFGGEMLADAVLTAPDINGSLLYFPIGSEGDSLYMVASMWSNETPYSLLFEVDAKSGEYSILWSNQDEIDGQV